jgi:tight adherence protein C
VTPTELTLGLAGAAIVLAGAIPVARVPRRSDARGSSRTPRRRHRTPRGRRRERLLDQVYPDALELFVVTVQSGLLPRDALAAIEVHVHPIVGGAIAAVLRRMRDGERIATALDAMVELLGTRALAFVATVGRAERTGLPIAPMVDRIADDARLHRRRLIEASARELPVRLALPLVLCTLPAFVLVAIAPLLIGALSSLRAA